VQRFLPLFAVAARRHRQRVGREWRVDETYCDYQGKQADVYRAIDEDRQVVDAHFSEGRNGAAARAVFERALAETAGTPVRVTTDKAKCSPPALRAVLPGAERGRPTPPSEADSGARTNRTHSAATEPLAALGVVLGVATLVLLVVPAMRRARD
jgi:transposase-like protein